MPPQRAGTGARLIVYTPADHDSRDRLEKLAAYL